MLAARLQPWLESLKARWPRRLARRRARALMTLIAGVSPQAAENADIWQGRAILFAGRRNCAGSDEIPSPVRERAGVSLIASRSLRADARLTSRRDRHGCARQIMDGGIAAGEVHDEFVGTAITRGGSIARRPALPESSPIPATPVCWAALRDAEPMAARRFKARSKRIRTGFLPLSPRPSGVSNPNKACRNRTQAALRRAAQGARQQRRRQHRKASHGARSFKQDAELRA